MKLTRGQTLGLALFLLAWASVLARVLTHFDPGSEQVTGWNSDAAITVLQSNDPVFDIFRLYYYGQDRIGAWPWLLAQGWRALTGFDWTPYRVFVWQAAWACAACLALWRLHRHAGWVLAAAYAALALLSPLFQVQLFALSQPFGWQLTAFFLAWWTLTRLLEGLAEPSAGRGAVWGWAGAATLFTTMACWTSPTSGPLLLAGCGLQGVRAWRLAPEGRRPWAVFAGLGPLAVGILFEALVRRFYHRFGRANFGDAYKTAVRLDKGHLLENARAMAGRISEHALGPVVFLGFALAVFALGYLLVRLRRRTLDARAPEVELAFLTAAFGGAALANVAITMLVLHVRINGHDIRYLFPSFTLGVLAAAAGGLFLLQLVPATRARVPAAAGLAALALLVGSHLLLAPRRPEPTLGRAQAAVDAVVARAPGTVLLGGYWDSYLLGALDPAHRLPTMAVDGDYVRTPFYRPLLREAQDVLVSFFQDQRVGTAAAPSPWLLQSGVPFQLADARFAEHPPFHFARYRSVRAHTVPVRLESAKRFEPCKPGEALTVHFEQSVERGALLLSTQTPAEGVEVLAPGAAEARMEGLPSLWLLHLRAGAEPLRQVTLRIRPDLRTEHCWFMGAALVTGAPLDTQGVGSDGR
ncbi:hypothetical protein P2318_10060 [Myxococcaceae bacterium GXIMD 01537]